MSVKFGGLHWERAEGKIADFIPGDVLTHEVDISGSVPSNCVAVIIEGYKTGGTGTLYVYPNNGAIYSVLGSAMHNTNRTAMGGFIAIIEQKLKLRSDGADGDWDIFIYGYLTQG